MSKIVFAADSDMVRHIASQDPEFGRLVDAVGDVMLSYRPDPYASLVRSIIGQQVSGNSASATWGRLLAASDGLSPKGVLSLGDEGLRKAGLSRQKISYVKDLSQKVLLGEIDLDGLTKESDAQVVGSLTCVRGIGIWTAQMFLIFTLGRLDVFAPSDLGLRKGIKWLYGLPELPKEREAAQFALLWQPYRTVASLYLWQVVTRRLG